MKIRSDREALLHLTAFPKLLIGERDPVLPHEETKLQVENTEVELIVFPDGHMTHIENEENEFIEVFNIFKNFST
jgi:pimeloyl-ACP methyl ester carboxylesterase